jgi:uncharacterized membrane protein YeaQ/YmgE (transglycosylase-associated protein family)
MNMTAQQLIIMALIGIVAGWLASLVVGGPGGILGYLVTGIIGAFVGTFIFGAAGWGRLVGNEIVDAILVSAIGAIVVIILAKIILGW